MSFRGDDQRRYGQVPPVQYPIAGQPQSSNNVGRRPSFNTGDDGAYHDQQGGGGAPGYGNYPSPGREDELFLTSPTSYQPGRPAGNALSGYQHQYQDPTPPTPSHSQYNPQSFAQPQNFQRSQSTTTLPYHPAPAPSRYASNATSYNSHTTNYAHQTYNPAAYAGAASPQRQATYHGYTQDQGYAAGGAHQQTYNYGGSPNAAYQPTFSHPAQSPALSSGYSHSPVSPNPNASYDPSSYAAAYNMNGSHSSPAQPAYSGTSQLPYPVNSEMPPPPSPRGGSDRGSYYNRAYRTDSQTSPSASPSAQPPPASPGLRRHPTNAPLPSRPTGEAPDPSRLGANGSPGRNDMYSGHRRITPESIIEDIEAELNGGALVDRSDSSSAQNHASHSIQRGSSNRTPNQYRYDEEDDDPEGTAAVLAMRDDEIANQRFSTQAFSIDPSTGGTDPRPPTLEEPPHDGDMDVGGGGVDLSMLSGGYAGSLTYGNEVGSSPGSQPHGRDPRSLSFSGHRNSAAESYDRYSNYENAEIDYGDTGGLQPPDAHRLSFDEGDERVSLHSRTSGTESPQKDDYQDLFYHPGLSSRPLPALPGGPGSDSSSMLSAQNSTRSQSRHAPSLSTDSRYPPEGPEGFYASSSSQSLLQPERSISMSSYSSTPLVTAPLRSRTDAAEERRKLSRQQQLQTQFSPTSPDYDTRTPTSLNAFDAITLPSGRKRKLIPSKLTPADFGRCREPWALSGIEMWIREMAEGDLDLKEKVVEDALIHLFTFKVPIMNVADAEVLSSHVVLAMLDANVLVPDEEWVKFSTGHVSGVFWQLTGSGCYASKLHDHEIGGRCYSYHCTRTLKKIDLDDLMAENAKPTDEWHVFYHLQKEDWESKPKKEVERQNILHEIVTGEENYMKQLDIFRTLYRDDLRAKSPPVLHPNRRDKFLMTVFGKLDPVIRVNKDHLLSQLKYRQQEQGPWITGFSDLFREWIRKAKSDYIEYATAYPRAVYMVRKETERNILFKKFLEDKQKHKSSLKQDWTHFLITPLQRLQRYILLLETVEHKMLGDSEEKTNLVKAINEIREVVLECDAKVEETTRRVEMMELDRMLVLRPGFQSVLNLDHMGRKLLMQGDLQRMGSKGMRWVDTHALLFDHYLILAKEVASKDLRAEKKYDVSREPIPMPLLFLESMNDEPIIKQKGITAPLARTTAASASGTQLAKVASNGNARPGLEHTSTSSSIGSSSHLTPTGANSDIEGKILYPFRIKHLGHEVYTLYASSARDRLEWCNNIIQAKTRHAKALFSQNAEPFRLRVLADAAFNYDASSIHARSAGVPVEGTPLDRAIQDIESVLGSAQGIAPVCRAQVNCATGFSAFGKPIIAIGTDYGIFISSPANPRGWSRTVPVTRVTQIAVLEEFAVCLVIADKSLISYPLDVIAPVSDFAPPANDTARLAPQRLAKDVTYFATARMKDRMLVFYKRKEGLHTSFKVLEPVLHKATDKKSRLFGGRKPLSGVTESFRDFDEFFFPTECFSLSLFQTYIAVATAKGIEMLTLDKKQPMSIPDLKAPAIQNIASRVRDQRPLGMFRLNDNEFILTYEDCAVYVDRHGDVSRTLIMEYTGKQKKARGATMFGQYLLLFNEDYVEVRNAENGRLRQIIAGRDVRVIDFGIRGPTGTNAQQSQQTHGLNGQSHGVPDASKGTVKLAMCHPELPGKQIILEMLLNDGHTET